MATLKDMPVYGKAHADYADRMDWPTGPVGQSRESDIVEQSNFATACKALHNVDPDENDWMICRFGHWGVGWVEEIFTRPGSPAGKVAEEMRESLSLYPVLSDDDLSMREYEAVQENWPEILGDLLRNMAKEFQKSNPDAPKDIVNAIRDFDTGELDTIMHKRRMEPDEHHDGWAYFNGHKNEEKLFDIANDIAVAAGFVAAFERFQ